MDSFSEKNPDGYTDGFFLGFIYGFFIENKCCIDAQLYTFHFCL